MSFFGKCFPITDSSNGLSWVTMKQRQFDVNKYTYSLNELNLIYIKWLKWDAVNKYIVWVIPSCILRKKIIIMDIMS